MNTGTYSSLNCPICGLPNVDGNTDPDEWMKHAPQGQTATERYWKTKKPDRLNICANCENEMHQFFQLIDSEMQHCDLRTGQMK